MVYLLFIDCLDTIRIHHLIFSNLPSHTQNSIIAPIPPKSLILDLGCGTGEPIAQFFIEKGFKLTGVDGSQKMVELCRKRFPDERWIVSDMRDINLQQQFDAILAWHSFFHLDHDSQRNMFKIFESHTKPGGVLAFTSGEEEGEVWSDNGGQQLYHASLSTKEYESLLKNSSFKVLVHKVCDPECGEATVWVAQKI
ncbi:dTDP-3-amino-3,4, 6-trideoxy-alpha-D-glucopyranose [Legionella pneumophila]|uniref:class I SAM-dependent methyltransferase n=1 Tax=Legionella pneumophila TaxID=446 RepID=UPI0005C43328|nr:class I SAM-dependent methyltransferase [Legionella pneumophila]GAN17063.1 dTDP-3-amino-3,4, 6-trideoxy-alpha-D-glucopyranose [Legionella pneumophila]GAN20169.1 dTDP-3-amino-3,4, 6-trideoxy-alpha-D-glucopyranose [Legionella pneumophila]